MQPFFEIKNDLRARVVYLRMSGIFEEEDIRAWVTACRQQATAPYKGKRHMAIADMRGLKVMKPAVAAIMGEEIGHTRKNGVVLCAHLSDHTVQRLQAGRLARANSPDDDITVDVATLEEAYKVVQEGLPKLDDPRYAQSIREAISMGG